MVTNIHRRKKGTWISEDIYKVTLNGKKLETFRTLGAAERYKSEKQRELNEVLEVEKI